MRRLTPCALIAAANLGSAAAQGDPSRAEVIEGLALATRYFAEQVATEGGYVYYYSEDLTRRWGEGEATPTQVWVQPPGTPAVGEAMLAAWLATGDPEHKAAALAAAAALRHGQLESGGWTNSIEFDPAAAHAGRYRGGRGNPEGRNYSTLDDDITPAALRFLIKLDRALEFEHGPVHEAAMCALDALLGAQLANGGFPQVWDGGDLLEVDPRRRASAPDYDWRTEHRVKAYWDLPTLNDGIAGTVSSTLIEAHRTYRDDGRFLEALRRFGGFLLRARLPEPQPAWAQQYTSEMRPAWARKFEPPAIATRESEDVLEALIAIAAATGDERFRAPVARSLEYLRGRVLPDGRLPRYIEIGTDRPLYMERRGDVYTLTHDDSRLPGHYAWKVNPNLDDIAERLAGEAGRPKPPSDREVERILAALDAQGRWVSVVEGRGPLVGQPKFQPGDRYLSSAVFIDRVTTLCEWLAEGGSAP